MSTEKWITGSGVGLTWTAAYTAAGWLDSLTNGSALLSDLAITNGTALDIFADVSIVLGSAAFVAPNYMGIYLYPLNSDGSTYGDGRFATAASGPPPGNYLVGNIGIVAATQAQEGSLTRIILPPGTFKFVIYNQGGVTLAGASANSLKYRTYNRAIA